MEWNDQIIDEALRQSAAALEKEYPASLPSIANVWAAIETQRSRHRIIRLRQVWTAAATIVLLATAVTLWLRSPMPPKGMVSETKPQPPATENEAMAYINHLCAGNNIVCHSPAFRELQTEWRSAATELTSINGQLKMFGNDEQLLRAKTRIEIHQARIVKAMLQIL